MKNTLTGFVEVILCILTAGYAIQIFIVLMVIITHDNYDKFDTKREALLSFIPYYPIYHKIQELP